MVSEETKRVLSHCSSLANMVNRKQMTRTEWFSFVKQYGENLYFIPSYDKIADTIQSWEETYDIHAVSYFDPCYPQALRCKMKATMRPLFFFWKGNIELLKREKIAIVGKRNHGKQAEQVCRYLVNSNEKQCIVSGGARGIDQMVQQMVSECNGNMIIVLPYGLASTKVDKICKEQKGHFLLLSLEEPQQAFQAHQAIRRNAIIYALAKQAFIVESGDREGGTWRGSVLALKNNWCDIRVWDSNEMAGNRRLQSMGAIPFSINGISERKEPK